MLQINIKFLLQMGFLERLANIDRKNILNFTIFDPKAPNKNIFLSTGD